VAKLEEYNITENIYSTIKPSELDQAKGLLEASIEGKNQGNNNVHINSKHVSN
jgi:hypothetical protein